MRRALASFAALVLSACANAAGPPTRSAIDAEALHLMAREDVKGMAVARVSPICAS
jgi:hypothetical protein